MPNGRILHASVLDFPRTRKSLCTHPTDGGGAIAEGRGTDAVVVGRVRQQGTHDDRVYYAFTRLFTSSSDADVLNIMQIYSRESSK